MKKKVKKKDERTIILELSLRLKLEPMKMSLINSRIWVTGIKLDIASIQAGRTLVGYKMPEKIEIIIFTTY